MELQALDARLTVCKAESIDDIDLNCQPLFVGITDEEISVVCPENKVPAVTEAREDGWRAFRICGELDFSLIGILSKITAVLAEEKIGVFAVSTYNTDYILTKEENFERALSALESRGYTVKRGR